MLLQKSLWLSKDTVRTNSKKNTYFDDLDELVDPGVPGEDGLAQHELSKHAPSRPTIN